MPSAKRLAQDKARERRSKIILAILGAVLLIVVGFEATTMLGGSGSKAAVTTAAGTTTAASTTAASTTAASTPAPVVQPASSQLASFSRFATGKDPFQGPAAATITTGTTASTPPSGNGSSATKGPKAPGKIPTPPVTLSIQQTTTPVTTTTQSGPLVPAAVLKLNGKKGVVTVGAEFPASHPVFKLLAVGQKTIWLQLVNGSLTNGSQTLVVHFGKPLKLVNQTAKLSYLLGFVKATAAPPPAKATPASDKASTTTTATDQTATVSAASP